jgi:glycosyltransferase involved in cell wall biosynthesis
MLAQVQPPRKEAAQTAYGAAPDQKQGDCGLKVALLTGGGDKPYALGLVEALAAQGIGMDFIGSDQLDCPQLRNEPGLNFLNLRGDQRPNASAWKKALRILRYYGRLLGYAATAKPRIFHVLWNDKFQVLDRTLIMLYYRLLGRRIVFTAHNVNAGKRDGTDTVANRVSLRVQYKLCDQIFVHTEKMKRELLAEFSLPERKVTVIPFGINNTLPKSSLTRDEARRILGVGPSEKLILFFGRIAPYKGLEYLISALAKLAEKGGRHRLLVAGSVKDCPDYWAKIQAMIWSSGLREAVLERIEFIPDEEVEIYFKGADVSVLPYTDIFQSGVLFLGYSFGLPVIATDVGSFREDILEGQTGLVCRARDPEELARAIETYFGSGLYLELESRRESIKEYANEKYSWTKVGQITKNVYSRITQRRVAA